MQAPLLLSRLNAAQRRPVKSHAMTPSYSFEHADAFRRDLHPNLRADYVFANRPFNDSDWFRQDDDVRWTEQQRGWSSRRLTRRAPAAAPSSTLRPTATPALPRVQHFIRYRINKENQYVV